MSNDNDVLVKVEGVSKKFCRDLKRSLWYGLKDISSELFGASKNGQLHFLPVTQSLTTGRRRVYKLIDSSIALLSLNDVLFNPAMINQQ